MDMSQYSKKPTPAQQRERLQWVLDTVRENQLVVAKILNDINFWISPDEARKEFDAMHKHDRDALLVPRGILTDEQIEVLK